jgi:acyl carrier protein phosphodiesterase
VNYLAHVFLARHDDAAMLGAMLGDFVFGRAALEDWPPAVAADILLHRNIDRYTDAHPAVLALRANFPDGRRRYAGIALDVYFDHLLARDWSRWCDEPLDVFTRRFYRVLLAALPDLPPRLQRIAPSIATHDWLGSYRARGMVDHAVTRIATRLSRNGERLVECLDDLRSCEGLAEATFDGFFPELVAFVEAKRGPAA